MRWIGCWVCCGLLVFRPIPICNCFFRHPRSTKPTVGGKQIHWFLVGITCSPPALGARPNVGRSSVGWSLDKPLEVPAWWSVLLQTPNLLPCQCFGVLAHLAAGSRWGHHGVGGGHAFGWLGFCRLHMASGFGVSALGLFGPTDPALTGPWVAGHPSSTGVPSHVRYRHTDDRWMRQLSVDMVLDRLEEIPMTPRRLWLGSGSPQRRAMLQEAGYAATPRPPHLDDGQLTPGDVGPEEWTLALACWKARAVAESLRAEGARGVVLAGDTVCTHRGEVMGKPRNQDHARVKMQAYRSATHPVQTGVCLMILIVTRSSRLWTLLASVWDRSPIRPLKATCKAMAGKTSRGLQPCGSHQRRLGHCLRRRSGHRDGLAFAAAGADAGRYGTGTISGRQPMTQGPAGPWSALLHPLSWVYGPLSARQIKRKQQRAVRVNVPVISVGNLAVGGRQVTFVRLLVGWLQEAGHQPAIAMRVRLGQPQRGG